MARRGWRFARAFLLLGSLHAAPAQAGQNVEVLAVTPPLQGKAELLLLATDPLLQADLARGISPDQIRLTVGKGNAKVIGLRRLADSPERTYTVIAFDGTASFKQYWANAIKLARTFEDHWPAGISSEVRLITFGLKLDDLGTATSPQDLRVLLDALAKKRPDQQATRLKAHVRDAARMAAAALPLSAGGVRQVIVFTDAGEESQAYTAKDLVAEANGLGVQLHLVTFYQATSRQPSLPGLLDQMRQLADETGGRSVEVGDPTAAGLALQEIAEAPRHAAWLSLGFCGVPGGGPQFDDSVTVEVLRGNTRAALSGSFPFRQDASGAAVQPCTACGTPCAAGETCLAGKCVPVQPVAGPTSAATAGQGPSTIGGGWGRWWWAGAGAVLLLILLARRARGGASRPSHIEQAPVAEPPPLPADSEPATPPDYEPVLQPKRTGPDVFKHTKLPHTLLVPIDGGPLPKIRLSRRPVTVVGSARILDDGYETIENQLVSRRHAEFTLTSTTLTVVDLNSSNGTYVDGVRLDPKTPTELRSGQVIEFSKQVRYRLEMGAGTPRSAPPPSTPAVAHTMPVAPPLPVQQQVPSPALGEASLSLLPGGDAAAPRAITVRGRLQVGRESGDVVIPVHTVSSQHAVLEYSDAVLVVTDLGSTNGTYVDGGRLPPNSPVSVGDGQVVSFSTRAVYRVSLATAKQAQRDQPEAPARAGKAHTIYAPIKGNGR